MGRLPHLCESLRGELLVGQAAVLEREETAPDGVETPILE